jgi:hypothetical protein
VIRYRTEDQLPKNGVFTKFDARTFWPGELSQKPTNEMVRRCKPSLGGGLKQRFQRRIIDMQIRSVGIDLGKTTFHLVALGASGKVLVKKKFTQKQLLAFTANMQTSLIGLEACSRAHFLGRALRDQGHDVRFRYVIGIRQVQQ